MGIPLKVLILGSGSAIPRKNKNHTSQLVSYNGKHFLLDCGESTQIQIKKHGASIQKIDAIFITHMHGDHYLGLPGLIFSMNLLGRKKSLNVYGPPGIKKLIDFSFEQADSRSAFPIHFKETQSQKNELLWDDEHVRIYSFPLKHKIPTTGFLVEAGSIKRKLQTKAIEAHAIPKHLRSGIAEGRDFVREDGTSVANQELTEAHLPFKTFAFCTDTAYLEKLKDHLPEVDLLYHETTFLEEDRKIAREKRHSTSFDAGKIAQMIGAKKLLIGHFSNKYEDDAAFLKECQQFIKNTEIAIEGECYEI